MNYNTFRKFFSQVMYMWNMCVLPPTVQKLCFQNESQRSRWKCLEMAEGSCHKEYTREKINLYLLRFKSYNYGYNFRNVDQRSLSQGQNVCNWQKGLIKRNTHVIYKSPTSYGSKVIINIILLNWSLKVKIKMSFFL